MIEIAEDVALEFTRKIINKKRGGKTSLVDSTFHAGKYSCIMCKMSYAESNKLEEHLSTKPHKEVRIQYKDVA